jgi:hypothetical protein
MSIGKDSLGLKIVESKSFPKHQDTIQIHLYNLDDYKRNQQKIKTILAAKGLKTVTVNYAENFLEERNFSYWLQIQKLVPFIAFAYDGNYQKNVISAEYESLYVWCFFTWIKVYTKENSKLLLN